MPISDTTEFSKRLEEANLARQRIRRKMSKELTLLIFAFLGSFMALGGILYTTVAFMGIRLTFPMMVGMLVSFFGLSLLLTSIWGITFIRKSFDLFSLEKPEDYIQLTLINEWIRFENAARLASHVDKKDPRYFSVRRLLQSLLLEKKIDDRDYNAILHALELRNRIVHGSEDAKISAPEVAYISKILQRTRSRLAEENTSEKELS